MSEIASPQKHKPFLRYFTDEGSNIWAENRLLRFVAVLSFVGTLAVAGTLIMFSDREKTILVPFGQSLEGLYLVGDTPSETYLIAIARNIVQLTGTYTSSSLEFQLDEVLKLVHPSRYSAVREEFRLLVGQLSDFREITFATHIRYEAPFEIGERRIRVPVKRLRFIGRSRTEDTGFVEMDYLVEEGRFWLTGIGYSRIGEGKNVQTEN
ncbi:TraE/TraK family type IV conjugative transfer system protein [Kordiimonas pumila]|uniref:TraE/TraK family type IV conjugative transfer system protein n=1 Tax=Kordiimonas pumila TaxID=2161677 RepID=A0ABV7D648_9PROT|nr:TraE/TraK family type IV conjugative transfer system protein [Kordiimonas pumila]